MPPARYPPIADYALIGDCHTAALVSRDGAIDWYCPRRFDAPAALCRLLDADKGGYWQLAPTAGYSVTRAYRGPTCVLDTTFTTAQGTVRLTDLMPIHDRRPGWMGHDVGSNHRVLRLVEGVAGAVELGVAFKPTLDFARTPTRVTPVDGRGAVAQGGDVYLTLACPSVALAADAAGTLRGQLRVRAGERHLLALTTTTDEAMAQAALSPADLDDELAATLDYWQRWAGRCTYRGPHADLVLRSALTLKLLTYEPTGAIVAAPTTSLPEQIGGVRNWDYRYTWMRDAAFTLYAFLRIGFTEEAARFMDWLEARCREASGDHPLQIVYRIDGTPDLTERDLGHLDGYRGSRPVRIGNGAHTQLQLDIYGELMDSVYLFNKYGMPISFDLWTHVRKLVSWLCDNWRRDDEGIWETRGGRRQFVYSKLMAWVAVDRGLRLADKRSFPADRARWYAERDAIYSDIMTRGWNERRGAFTQFYGSDALDASNLIMPLVFFLSPVDPKMLATIDATMKAPNQAGLLSDGLVYRYDPQAPADGLPTGEGTFNMCTFWLVEALTRAGRADRARLEDARLLFEQMLGYANHVGLYAEQTGSTGEALGNYPQALTHLALISAAYNLDRTLDEAP